MDTLQGIQIVTPKAIFGNPLLCPNGPIIEIQKIRDGILSRAEVVLEAQNIELQHQKSKPGVFTVYEGCGEFSISSGRGGIGKGYIDCCIGSASYIDEMGDPENIEIEKLCDKGLIDEVSLKEAYIRVALFYLEHLDPSEEYQYSFGEAVTEQIEFILSQLEDLGLVDQKVWQVSDKGSGEVLIFPKNYRSRHLPPASKPPFIDTIRELGKGLGPTPVPV